MKLLSWKTIPSKKAYFWHGRFSFKCLTVYHEGNISNMPDLDGFFSVLECEKRKSGSHGKRKNGKNKRKICTENRLNTSLNDLSIALNNHDWHGLFSFLSSLPISVLRNLEL